MRSRVVSFCFLLVVAAGCGSAAEQSLPTTDPDPMPDTALTPGTTMAEIDDAADDLVIPMVTFTGQRRDEPVPYFGSQRADGGVQSPAAGFEPAPADAPFCAAIDEINARPQPSDDFEEVVVAQQYFLAIEPVVPTELATHFDVGLDWLSEVVASGSFLAGAEPTDGDALLESIGQITTWVDQRCLGR